MRKSIRKHLLAVLIGACLLFTGAAFAACGGDTACEHRNATAGTNTATCEDAGVITYTCPDCGESWEEPTEALGHDWDDGTSSTTTLCTEARVITYTCTRSGCGETRQETLPAASSHVLDDGTVTKEATCTENGECTYHCTNEGCSYSETAEIIAVGAHTLDDGTVTKEATCTEAEETTYRCTAEGCEYSEVRTTAAALGHSWDSTFACVERHCTRTGCEEEQPATAAHSHVKDVAKSTAADCTTGGEDVYVCSVCGGDEYSTPTQPLGHTMVAGDPEDGDTSCEKIVTYTCERGCGHTEQETTYAHTYVTTIKTAATCTAAGTTHEICSSCGEEKANSEKSYTDTNAHKWDAGTTEGGLTKFTCAHNSAHTKTAIVAEGSQADVTKEALTAADEVSLDGTRIAMDADTVEGLDESGSYTLAAEITTEYPTVEGGVSDNVFSITLSNGAENITDFDGTVTVSLPYELKDGDNIDAIYIGYINENGEIEEVEGTYSNGYVTFTTTHFSFYTVRQYTAAQMCEKYGHNTLDSSREATCTADGYVLSTCTRCGQILENRILPALGHSWGEATGTEATCTAAGTMTRTCTRDGCTATSVTVTPALGHDWVASADGTVAATCTTAGKTVYICAREDCAATYTETVAALGHSFRETVTAATCTTAGYTTHTCTRAECGYSYTDSVVAALGHSWDIAEPTCGRGQTCTVCGAAGASATGAHTMVNGVCSVCGQGCTHNYVAGTVVASTCTQRGYTVYTCSACGSTENRDYVSAAGHSYDSDWTQCSVCGEANPSVDTVYGNMIKDMMSGEYVISSEDGSIVYTFSSDTSQSSETVTIELFEVVIKIEDGLLLFSADGKMELENDSVYGYRSPMEFRMYGDGAYLWMEMDNKTIYDDDNIYESHAIQVGTYESTLFSMFGTGESAERVAEVVGMFIGLFDGENDTVNDGLKVFAQEFLLGKAVEGGYEFALDYEALKALNEALYTQNPAGVIDLYAGEGAYASILEYLAGNEDMTLSQFKTLVLDNLEYIGIARDDVVAIANVVLSAVSGEEVELDELIAENPTMTIGQIICWVMGADPAVEGAYEGVLEQLDLMLSGEQTAYELVGQMMGISAETLASIYETANEIFDGGNPAFSLKTDANGFISDLTFGASELELVFGNTNYVFDLLADVKFDTSEGLEENLGLKTDVSEKTAAVFTVIEENCRQNGGTYQVTTSDESLITFTLSGGVLSAVIEDVRSSESYRQDGYYNGTYCYILYQEREVYAYIFSDVTDLAMAYLSDDCGDAYSIQYVWLASDASSVVQETRRTTEYYAYATEELLYEQTRLLSSETLDPSSLSGLQAYCAFYYDPVSGEFDTQSLHSFTEKSELIAGDSPCDDPYYYEVCAKCGAYGNRIYEEGLGHILETTVEYLNEGSTSCEDGIRVTETCTREGCDYVNEYTTDYHLMLEETIVNVAVNHEGMTDVRFTVIKHACLCGAQEWVDIDEDVCTFDLVSEENGVRTYRCAITGCDISYTETETYVPGEGCRVDVIRTLAFYQGTTLLGEIEYSDGYYYEHDYTYSETTEGDLNGEWTRITRNECACGAFTEYRYTYVHEGDTERLIREESTESREDGNGAYDHYVTEYDGYGRTTSRLSEIFLADGTLDSYSYCEYTYFVENGICIGEVSWYNEDDEFLDSDLIGNACVYGEIVYEKTCTQYTLSECLVCGHIGIASSWEDRPHGHSYVDGVCEYCGLQNAQSADLLELEDLTDDQTYGQTGSYVIGVWTRDGYSLYGNVTVSIRIVGLSEDAQIAEEGVALRDIGTLTFGKAADVYDSMLYVFDQAAVAQAASEAGIGNFNLNDYGIEVNFVPAWASSGIGEVCSITLTDFAADI